MTLAILVVKPSWKYPASDLSAEIPVLSEGPGEGSALPVKFLSFPRVQEKGPTFQWNSCPVCELRRWVCPSGEMSVLSVSLGKGSALLIKFLSCLWAPEKGPLFQWNSCPVCEPRRRVRPSKYNIVHCRCVKQHRELINLFQNKISTSCNRNRNISIYVRVHSTYTNKCLGL